MLLKNLINFPLPNIKGIKINGLSLDSRKVRSGNLFFALKGSKSDGNKYIKEAIKNGAKAIISSTGVNYKNTNIRFIKAKNIRKTLAYACKKFYNLKPKNIVAVTGTNGKSSVADFFYQILLLNKKKVASIGTLGIKRNKNIKKINLTSPDIISLHKELSNLKKQKIDNVIIEASSHGLQQGRLDEINFKVGIFTNFSQDHLDYHKTMNNYFNAKLILFSNLMKKNNYIITDKDNKKYNKLKKVAIKNKLKLRTIEKSYIFKNDIPINLIGNFQLKNLSMSIIAAQICGIKNYKIKKIISKIKSVNGRLELIKVLPNKAKVFIDYAHTPEALFTAIDSLQKEYNQDITLIFGCGGERDFKKRPMMAKVANKFCKKIYVTDDNPRNENPKKIRKQIIKHLKLKNFFEISNREKAIKHSVLNSSPNEIILIAGKGHETEQNYGRKIINISDKTIVNKIKIIKNNYINQDINYRDNSKILNKILQNKLSYKFNRVSINSKEVKKNHLFIAINGKNNDGHHYVKEAIKNGAKYSVISKKIQKVNLKKLIKVDDTYDFLNKFALCKRGVTQAKIIAITGSSGKTTVKTILSKLLNMFSSTFFSPKSYNNHYGVPISLSNLEHHHKYGVFEIGMSNAGEINKLSKLVKPHIAVITNVAEAHIENFKNIKHIAKAKGEIISNIDPTGFLIINRDDKFYKYFNNLANKRNIKTISFGFSRKSDIHPIHIKSINNKKFIKVKIFNKELRFSFKNINTYNILISLAVLNILNLDLKKITKSIENLEPLEGRGKIFDVKRFNTSFKLIDDSYNANPLSVKNAINNISVIKRNNFKKYILIGDMLELGDKSIFFHKNLSQIINNADIDKVFIYGNKIRETYKYIKKNKRGNILQDTSDFDEIFSKILNKNDYLMIKGSNATNLNKLSNKIITGKKIAF